MSEDRTVADSVATAGGVVIALGDQQAVIDHVGATLRSYRVDDHDVVVPTAVGSTEPGMHGCILAPWPNRLQDGCFHFDGVEHHVPINEPERHNANHGLVWTRTWRTVEHLQHSVRLQCDLDAASYGHALQFEVRYELASDGLHVTVETRNTGASRAPLGIGFHPWLSPGTATVDECILDVDASRWLECDARLLPVAWRAVPEGLDFSGGRRLAGVQLDDAFLATGEVSLASGHRARLVRPDGFAVEVHSDSGLPFWQVCTGDFDELGALRRAGVAVEPMSCPANALVTGDHLAVIEPGGVHRVTWRMCLVSMP